MYACYNNGLYSGYLIREQYARTRVFQHACILKEDILLDKGQCIFKYYSNLVIETYF
jgi:hypothetical protein